MTLRCAQCRPVPSSPVLTALGKAVRGYRAEQNISQEELGYRAGLHRTYLSGIERGERSLVTALNVALQKLTIGQRDARSRNEAANMPQCGIILRGGHGVSPVCLR